jgi:phosphatidylinositol alpha-mannosyltransferase
VSFAGRAVRIPANGSVAPIAFGPLTFRAARRHLVRFAPDVIHVHEPLIPSVALLSLLATDRPAVGTFHASAPRSLGYAAARPLLERAARRLDRRVAVSGAALALAERYFPGDYELIPNGVDARRFADASPADLGAGAKVLFLSRLESRKGLHVLIEAMTHVDHDVELVVAGSGPEEERCRNLARRVGVKTRFLGHVPESEVPGLYKRADIYCAPATGGESFGIVLAEAMSAGVPVVCSDLEGFRSAAGESAEFVRPADPAALGAAIGRVLRDGALAARLRAAGPRRAALFDWSNLVERIEDTYRAALEG